MGLTVGTKYYVRAYATSAVGTAYGSIRDVTMPASSGTIRLDLASATGLTPTVSNVPFTFGQVYTIDKTAPAAPVVTTPANGSTTSDTTPTCVGTADASTTVSIYLDGVLAGTTTADASGNWNFTSALPLANGSHTVRATATDALGNVSGNSNSFIIDTTTPTTISISNSTVSENLPVGTLIGILTATAPITGQIHTYTLVPGTGSTDNGSFTIVGNGLRTGAVFDFETQSSYTIRGRATNALSQFVERAFVITISDVGNAGYVSSTTEQITQGVLAGTTNQALLRIIVTMNDNADNSLSAKAFNLTNAGTTLPADIAVARVYYTGPSNAFATSAPFGSLNTPGAGAFSISGSQVLQPGDNYFWLAYDVAPTAATGNLLDATLPSFTVGGTGRTPAVTAPLGARTVVAASQVAGQALRFSGTAIGYVDFGVANLDLILGSQYTQELWVKPTAASGSTMNGVLGYDPGVANQRSPYSAISENNRVEAGFGTGLGITTITTNPNTVTQGQWNHVVATYDGTELRLYVNGSLALSTNAVIPPVAIPARYVGTLNSTATSFFKGEIDEVTQWKRALSQDEIRLRRHLVLSGREMGLASYAQFNEASGNVSNLISSILGALTGSGVTRVASTAPVGFGESSLQAVSNGSLTFTNTRTAINFTGVTGSSAVVVARLAGRPLGTQPTGLPATLNNTYWIINQYGTGFFNAAVTYTLSTNKISAADAATPNNLKLLRRTSNSDGAFDAPLAASGANQAASSVTFSGLTSFGQTVIGTSGTSPLPVELVSFMAERQADDVLLRWQTAQELNNAYFVVESSPDGREFQALAQVPGHGNSAEPHYYQLTDVRATRYGQPLVYYRLCQVDTDGSSRFSPVVTMALTSLASVKVDVFPNPAADELRVRISGLSQGSMLARLVDAQGREVLQTDPQLVSDSQSELSTSVRHLPAGAYILTITLPDRVVHRLVLIGR
ncbi:LamG-like jellyroll fold domain-containing protein [Hymenobacter terrenus]|uniref:LamG-like jellyroll fold domain-containing protein n=1 Tax=Hymenobacter terrenus TaxID=1629124 RepID=UPI0006195E42|nr:LamG-like jellyroll fold domain-containing protein [Hymenobacter terrenus]